jgi:hypothetical protein
VNADTTVSLEGSFASSSVYAKLSVLILIASAFRPHLTELMAAADRDGGLPEGMQILDAMAEVLCSQMGAIRAASAALVVWNQFRGRLTVAWDLGAATTQVLNRIEQDLTARTNASGPQFAEHFLHEANVRAAEWISQDILPNLGRPGIAPAPVRVAWDQKAESYCASAARLTGTIGWTLQPCKHSFYAGLVAERVLEHEYLSHLLPGNQRLSKGVREVWLMETLEEEHRNDQYIALDRKHVLMTVWAWFRMELENHFVRKGVLKAGVFTNFEDLAIRVRRRSLSSFWKMTGDIINLSAQQDPAPIERALKMLRPLPDDILDALTVPWVGFAACMESARAMGIDKM